MSGTTPRIRTSATIEDSYILGALAGYTGLSPVILKNRVGVRNNPDEWRLFKKGIADSSDITALDIAYELGTVRATWPEQFDSICLARRGRERLDEIMAAINGDQAAHRIEARRKLLAVLAEMSSALSAWRRMTTT